MLHIYDAFFLYLLSIFPFSCCFLFTIEELKSINYEVEILQTPMKKEEGQSLPVVHMTSIFGQDYQCLLPQVEEEEISEKLTQDDKNTDITELIKPLHTGNCLLKAKDWWTYELCFGQYIKQFHIEDGQIMGNVLTLGHYESDYDWNNDTDQDKFKLSKQKYHSQYYINGTKCDLTGQPRVAEVRIFCEEDSGDYIQRVDEPGTCSYVIAVHTSRVCSHPELKPLPSKKMHTIPCHPLLNEEQYSSYLEKLNEERALADQKRSQWLNNQQERLKVMKSENLLQSNSDEYKELKEFYKYLIEDKEKEFNLDDLSVNKIEKNNEQPSKAASLSKNEKSNTNEKTQDVYYEEYEKELDKLKLFLSPEKFAVVKSNIEEFYDSVVNEAEDADLSELSEEEKDATYVKFFKFLKKLDKVGKDIEAKEDLEKEESVITESSTGENSNENGIKAESVLGNKQEENPDELKVRIRRLDQAHSDGKVYEIDRVQQKKLERTIKEKLEKYGVNTEGRRIEVKIIKAGYYDSHLTDDEANQFENMITALLTGEQEAIQEMERNKKLEENYKFTWNNEINENEDEE